MVRAADFTRDRDELLQAQMISCVGRDAKAIPCRAAVHSDGAPSCLGFECGKCITDHVEEARPLEDIELLLGIVQIVDVDYLETKIASAAFDLIIEIAR